MKTESFKVTIKPAWADRAHGRWYNKLGGKEITVCQSDQKQSYVVTEGANAGLVIEKDACSIV